MCVLCTVFEPGCNAHGFLFSLPFKRLRVLFFAFQETSLRHSYKHTSILFWDTSICDNIKMNLVSYVRLY